MTQNVYLHFPVVDLMSLQDKVREHTKRVVRFLHQHNDYVNKCKDFTLDKDITSFPLYFAEVVNRSACSDNVLLGEDDIFGVIENNCSVKSDVSDDISDSVISPAKFFDLKGSDKGLHSDLEWRNIKEEFGNLTTLSCPITFPSEEKPIFYPVTGFESPPKPFYQNIENSENKYSEIFVNDKKIEPLNFSVNKNVEKEDRETKMEFGTDDEVVVIEVKKEKTIEVVTIDDDEEEELVPQVENEAKEIPIASKPSRTTSEVLVEPRIPTEDLTPPFLTPEVTEPPYLLPGMVDPVFNTDSSQPPLIFPEIDPPLWSFSAPSPVNSSEDAQPPVLTPEVKDTVLPSEEGSSDLLVSDETHPALIASELAPILISAETTDCSPLCSDLSRENVDALITIDSSESSRESVNCMNFHKEPICPFGSHEQSVSVIVCPKNLTSHTTCLQHSGSPFSQSDAADQAMITPKKTTDITKIKGWKRKQFFMDNFEDDEVCVPSKPEKIKKNGAEEEPQDERQVVVIDDEESNTIDETAKNAFVCDSLDKFLEGEANLNIDFEVPHLYAEVGIRLTKDDVVSTPNVSEEELKRVGGKYRVPIELKDSDELLVESGNMAKRGIKRKLKRRSKSSKARKLEVNGRKKSTAKVRKKETSVVLSLSPKSNHTKVTKQRSCSSSIKAKDPNGKAFEGLGSNKVLGLALYPGPNAPLPKAVQRHLDNIRSYRNTVDRNWANFALSALYVPKRSKYERMILPVQYNTGNLSGRKESTVVPSEVKEVVTELVDAVCKKASQSSSKKVVPAKKESPKNVELQMTARLEGPKKICRERQRTDNKTDEQGTNLKQCKVLVSKVSKPSPVCCLEHKLYNCKLCEIARLTQGEDKNLPAGGVVEREFFMMSTPLVTDKDIATLLKQKLRSSNWKNVAINNNIDILRTVVPNTLEFIKLTLVRENFLKKRICIWYLKPHPNLRNKSRAFLTFSKTSPVPYAIKLTPDLIKTEEMVPKIIKEIVATKEDSGENEYAIMHCNGKVWEIHGSLRYATRKPNPENFGQDCLNREEVFTPTYPPELERISNVATKVTKEQSARWWVLDLSQNFSSIVSEMDSCISMLTKKTIFNKIRMRFYDPLTLNRTSNRILWLYLIPKILPFVLIGPYKIAEPHGLVLKEGLKPVPFSYSTTLCTPPSFFLKQFINSVITQVSQQERELKGLWLCDWEQGDKTCYLELITSSKESNFSKIEYNVDVEHGYSLKSLVNSPPLKDLKRKLPQNSPKVKVYLYFDVFELGYYTGELLSDDTVLTTSPLNNRLVTIPSYGFGNWFIKPGFWGLLNNESPRGEQVGLLSLIKDKINFIPNNLKLKWFVTKNLDDLENRQPFSDQYLDGNYMLCEVGPDGLLQLVNLKTNELEVEKPISSRMESAEKNQRKRLEYLLYGNSSGTVDLETLLNKAEDEIKELECVNIQQYLVDKRLRVKKFELGSKYIQFLETLCVDEADKISWFASVKEVFMDKKTNDIAEEFKEVLLRYKFGRVYLILNGEKKLIDLNIETWKHSKEETKESQSSDERETKHSHDVSHSVIEVPVVKKTGNRRKKNTEATKTTRPKTKETTTIRKVAIPTETRTIRKVATPAETATRNPDVVELVLLDPPSVPVSNPMSTDTGNVSSHPDLPQVEIINIQTVNPVRRRPNPPPLTPISVFKARRRNAVNQNRFPRIESTFTLQSTSVYDNTLSEHVIVIDPDAVPVATSQEQPVTIVTNLIEGSNESVTTFEVVSSAEGSVQLIPIEEDSSDGRDDRDVRPSTSTTTTTSTVISIPNNWGEGDNDDELNELLIFTPESGCFVKYVIVNRDQDEPGTSG